MAFVPDGVDCTVSLAGVMGITPVCPVLRSLGSERVNGVTAWMEEEEEEEEEGRKGDGRVCGFPLRLSGASS